MKIFLSKVELNIKLDKMSLKKRRDITNKTRE
jgi:hypothetical protein